MRYLLLIIGVLALVGCGKEDFPKTDSAKIQTTSESSADSESKAEIVPITAEEAADIIDNAIRKKLKKYTGGLTESDLEKVSSLNLSPPKETEKWSYIYTYPELKNHRPIWWGRAGLREVAKLQQLEGLYLIGCDKISDDGMRELVKLQQLSYLNLEGTAVTITGLKQISKLKNLSNLNLWGSGITDEGLKEVAKLMQLKKLNLNNNEISDVGLKEIAKLTQLTSLSITSDYATEAGRDHLQKALPNCEMWFGCP